MERFVLTCGSCQRNKAYTARASGIPTPLEASDWRWQAVALDLVSLADSVEGYDAVVVFTDMFTKQIFCTPVLMKDTTAEKVADLFILHVFQYHHPYAGFAQGPTFRSRRQVYFSLLGTAL